MASMRNPNGDSLQAEATNCLLHHAIDIREDELRLAALQQKLDTPPRILSRSAGRHSCSIFKVPRSFVEVNVNHYHPQILSVGPFHRGKPHLEMIQEHKYHYLSILLARSKLTLKDLFQTLEPVEKEAREAYSEEFDLDRHDFMELMVVDGCFIIELFRKVAKLVPIEPADPVLSLSWIFSFLMRDLLLLENQLPFFVLQRLFNRTMGTTDKEKNASLVDIFFGYLSYAYDQSPEVIQSLQQFKAKHLLDLYRTSFIPTELKSTMNRALPAKGAGNIPQHVIHCISKLRKAGIKIRTPKKNGSSMFLAVKFRRREGVIEMPTVIMDDFMCSFFANCVAYEISSYKCRRYFTSYTAFLDYLINSEKDVEYLRDHSVIENYLGTDAEVADFINNVGRDAPFDLENCYLEEVFEQVNHYHRNNLNVQLAGFKYTYFRTPWSFISALAAFLLLILSVVQTVFAILGYRNLPQI